MFRLFRKMLIGIMSVFLLCFIVVQEGDAAGIELAMQEEQTTTTRATDDSGEDQNSFADYDIPIGSIETEEETQSQTVESETAQVVSSGQNLINRTVNVGARTVDSTRTRVLVICLLGSAGILSAGLLYRHSRRRSC